MPQVQTLRLEASTWQGWVASYGVVEALVEVDVAAELSGTVSAVYVDEGDSVTAGQLLLELDPSKRELALEQASKEVQRTRAALEEARLKLERRVDLAQRETISREVLDNAQLAVDATSATHQRALAAEQLARRELADTRIESPTAGLVDVQYVEPGEPVMAGASLIKLQASGGFRVQTWVSESDVLLLSPGNTVEVEAAGLPGQVFPGRIEWVGVKADAATGNFPVKLVLETAEASLRPGMTASVKLQARALGEVLALPENALVDRDRRRVVFVVEEGVARRREPVLGAGLSGQLRVLAGLAPGEEIIVSGQRQLVDGSPVSVAP